MAFRRRSRRLRSRMRRRGSYRRSRRARALRIGYRM